MNDFDIMTEAKPDAKTGDYSHGYFVATEKQLVQYGYKKKYISKLKSELIEKGFIKVVYGGKGRYSAWNKNVTVYQFIDAWKSFHSPL
jgi:hypothetical protein